MMEEKILADRDISQKSCPKLALNSCAGVIVKPSLSDFQSQRFMSGWADMVLTYQMGRWDCDEFIDL